MYKIMSNIRVLYNTNIKLYLKLFDSLVEPILSYGSEVWSISNLPISVLDASNIYEFFNKALIKNNYFNKIHIRFCKFVLQTSRYYKHLAVLTELGRIPILIKQTIRSTKFYL